MGADIYFQSNAFGDIEKVNAGNGESQWEAGFTRDMQGLEIERSLPGGIRSRWERDSLGRPRYHSITGIGMRPLQRKSYQWGINDRLQKITDELTGNSTAFGHDAFGNLSYARYADNSYDYRLPDAVGNLFRTSSRKDRKYGPAGQLLESEKWVYYYDSEGNLQTKNSKKSSESWQYCWNASGMLSQVVRPDGSKVNFRYAGEKNLQRASGKNHPLGVGWQQSFA